MTPPRQSCFDLRIGSGRYFRLLHFRALPDNVPRLCNELVYEHAAASSPAISTKYQFVIFHNGQVGEADEA